MTKCLLDRHRDLRSTEDLHKRTDMAHKVSARGARGAVSISWYRGEHAGRWNAIQELKKLGHLRISEKLRKHYGLNEEGNL